ncbi:DUF1822 domain-containing protein [Tumidithrix helvetica PCC 7403]|uniref:hypothetical protein n=1 Tax=Tumidithrix helvetica TaxID=3457545 RepID=UPI003CB21042
MLDLEKIGLLAQSYAPQELIAALVWQRQFNEFDGQEVIADLASHPNLWHSFLFSKPIYATDKNGLSFHGVLDTLLAMANYRPMPETSMIHFIPYPADTLYVLAENQDTIVSQLLDLGKKWRADAVDICDGSHEDADRKFRNYISLRLQGALWGEDVKHGKDRDAVIISYWWD